MIEDKKQIRNLCREHIYLLSEKDLEVKFKLIDEAMRKLRPKPCKNYRKEWLEHKA